jgi:hypothetical protein
MRSEEGAHRLPRPAELLIHLVLACIFFYFTAVLEALGRQRTIHILFYRN